MNESILKHQKENGLNLLFWFFYVWNLRCVVSFGYLFELVELKWDYFQFSIHTFSISQSFTVRSFEIILDIFNTCTKFQMYKVIYLKNHLKFQKLIFIKHFQVICFIILVHCSGHSVHHSMTFGSFICDYNDSLHY